MSKCSSKSKRPSKALALPALGIAGVTLALASGASASTGEATSNMPSTCHEIFLGEEEISDVSLATFYVFDKENAGLPPLAQKLRLARCGGGYRRGGACGGCGGCGGVAAVAIPVAMEAAVAVSTAIHSNAGRPGSVRPGGRLVVGAINKAYWCRLFA